MENRENFFISLFKIYDRYGETIILICLIIKHKTIYQVQKK